MAAAQASADALLTEHFRYTPLEPKPAMVQDESRLMLASIQSLIDDIINTINTIVYRAINAVETGLLSTPPSTLGFQTSDGQDAEEVKRIELEDGVHRLETLLEATVDRNFDKLEIYALRNVLCIDETLLPWVRLAHYKDLELPLPAAAPTPASIQSLREQLRASESLSLALEVEAAATQNMLTQLSGFVNSPITVSPDKQDPSKTPAAGALSFLTSTRPSATVPAPLTENAAFAVSQLPALRALLATLRPALTRLNTTTSALTSSRVELESERAARRAYIDGEVERAVKGAVGVVSDDGESAGLRRGIAESDVTGLEAAIAQRKKAQGPGDRMEQ